MKIIIVILFVLGIASLGYSNDIFVPAQYQTIQQAIDAAPSGSVIYIDGGTYNEKLKIINKTLTIKGLWKSVNGVLKRPLIVFDDGENGTKPMDQVGWIVETQGTGTEYVIFQNLDIEASGGGSWPSARGGFKFDNVTFQLFNVSIGGYFTWNLIYPGRVVEVNNCNFEISNVQLTNSNQSDEGIVVLNSHGTIDGLSNVPTDGLGGRIDHVIDINFGLNGAASSVVEVKNCRLLANIGSWGECIRTYSNATINAHDNLLFRAPGGDPWDPNDPKRVFFAGIGINGTDNNMHIFNNWFFNLPVGINIFCEGPSQIKVENNIIEDSDNQAVRVANFEDPQRIIDFGGGPLGSAGNNFFVNHDLNYHWYIKKYNNIDNAGYITIPAKNNYWSYYSAPLGLDMFIYDNSDDAQLMKVDYGSGLNNKIQKINAAPFFVLLRTQYYTNEDLGQQTRSNAAIGINDGNPNEDQALTFVVTNNNPGLFSVQPAIDAAGTLTFTPAPDKNGAALVAVKLQDNGSANSPNINISDTQYFTINIQPEPDPPISANNMITAQEDQTYTFVLSDFSYSDPDGDPLTDIWLQSPYLPQFKINGQSISPNNNHLTTQDIINGKLTYVPQANYNGSPTPSFTFKVANSAQTYPLSIDYTMSTNTLPINDKPFIIDSQPGPVDYVRNSPFVKLASGINVFDVDSQNLTMLTISSPDGNPIGESLEVTVPAGSGIAVKINNGLTLTLTGSSSINNYAFALQSVRYKNNSNFTFCSQRTFNIAVKDDFDFSDNAVKTVNLTFPIISNNVITQNGGSYCAASIDPPLIIGSTPLGGNDLFSYQWQSASSANGPWSDIIGATSKDLDPSITSSSIAYRRTVVSACFTSISNSDEYVITGHPPLNQNIIVYGSTSICYNGGSTTLYVSPEAGVSYQWKKDGVNIVNATLNSYVVTGGLTADGVYTVELTSCSSITSNGVTITTFIDCTAHDYCASVGLNSSSDWIDLVQLAMLNNPSSQDNGYKFYNNVAVPDLTRANGAYSSGSYDFSFSGGVKLGTKNHVQYWKTWIDFNQDGDFTDANELVINTSSLSTSTLNATINIPADASIGNTRMRVAVKYGSTPTGPCEIFPYGEVEDYIVNIIDLGGSSGSTMRKRSSEVQPTTVAEDNKTIGIYPNPVKERLFIEAPDGFETGRMYITNVLGEKLYDGALQKQMEADQWAAGVYILTIEAGARKLTYRFVKQ